MSVSAISSAVATASPAPVAASSARALDGDFKKPNPLSAQVKDSDGDYKAASSSPAASSSSAVQSALTTLKTGG
ncbi:MAG: hypothetical protein ABSE69_01240 [Roseiarcus sp.]